jgi:hypothetical protein
MKATSVFFGSFDRYLRILWALVAAGGLGLVALYSWSPEVAPMLPGHLSRPDLSRSMADAEDGDAGDEFVSRPLFVQGRRPLAAVTAPVAKVVKNEPLPPPKVLENVKLLGVFSSGDAKGVILQENGGDRRRLLVGDTTGAWTLTAVEPRGAVFKSGGVESRLAMGLLAAGLPAVRRAPNAPVTPEGGADAAKEEGAEPAKSWTPSFSNIYEKRRQRKSAPDEAGAAADAPDTEKRD